MYRNLLVLALFVAALGVVAGTGAFTGGDEAVPGVYLSPADSPNGDRYAEFDDDGDLRVELDDLNSRATTVIDSVFTISSANEEARVWIEHDGEGVTFYRVDTRTPIDAPTNAAELSANETIAVGVRVESDRSREMLDGITLRAEIPEETPTTEPPTTTQPQTTTDPPTTTQSPTTTEQPATTQPLTTTGPPTTTGPTTTQSPTTGTTTGTDATETQAGPPPTTTEEGTTTRQSSTPSTAEGTRTGTEANGTTVVAVVSPPAGTETTAPGTQTTATTTDDDQFEVGGLSVWPLLGLLGALSLLPLLFFAYRRFNEASTVTVETVEGSGLAVEPGSFDADYYDVDEDVVTFRFTETEPWGSKVDQEPLGIENVASLTNTTDSDLVITPRADEALADGVRLVPGGTNVDTWPGTYRLASGETVPITVVFPGDFTPDGDVSVVFDGEPSAD